MSSAAKILRDIKVQKEHFPPSGSLTYIWRCVIMNKLDSYIQKHRWTGLMAGIVIALVVATILKMIMELTRPVFF